MIATNLKPQRRRFTKAERGEISRRIHAKIDAFTKGLDPAADHIWPHTKDPDGYAVLKYRDRNGIRHEIRIARWLLGETRGRELDVKRDEHALHDNRCGSKRCINLQHLRIGTDAQNKADKIATGKRAIRAINTQVGYIYRDLHYNAGVSMSKIASQLGVPYGTVRRAIKKGKP